MSVHIQRLSNKNLNLVLRIYSGVPNDVPAFHHRLDYEGVCNATIKSRSKHVAWVFAYHGSLDHKDIYDIAESLHKETGITEMMYERAEGYIVHLVRKGKRKWKRKPVKRENVRVLTVNFSGFGED